MKRQEIDVRVRSAAPPRAVFALLRDSATWPNWSPIDTFELVRATDDGVGEIRIFRTKRWSGTVVNREQVLDLVPDKSYSYTTLSGLPIRDYRADVELTPDGDGTRIRWHSTFLPKVPATGAALRRTLAAFIDRAAHGLATHAATTIPPDTPTTHPVP